MLIDAMEARKLPRKEFDIIEVIFTDAVEKLDAWKTLETKQRRELQNEFTSQLLIHRNMMEGFEYVKRKSSCSQNLFFWKQCEWLTLIEQNVTVLAEDLQVLWLRNGPLTDQETRADIMDLIAEKNTGLMRKLQKADLERAVESRLSTVDAKNRVIYPEQLRHMADT
jgi:hypothetical protein